jgi:hypothetical protein
MTSRGPEAPEVERRARPGASPELRRIAAAALAGALFAGAGVAALGLTLGLLAPASGAARAAAIGLREFLNAGGWIRLPLWGGALGALRALGWARAPRARVLGVALAVGLLGLSATLRPDLRDAAPRGAPGRGPVGLGTRGAAAKATAIRRWSFASPAGVRQILALRHDPNALVREQVALALGVNLVVSDIEHAGSRPGCEACPAARFATLPLRDSLRAGLLALLRDSIPAVRAEAARALWNAPVTFGPVPAAAESLAAVLARAEYGPAPGLPERLVWLALDAAAGAPHPGLKRAAARFATTTGDTALRRAALLAAAPRAAAAPDARQRGTP